METAVNTAGASMKIAVVLYDFVEPIEIAILGTLSMAKRVYPRLTYFTVSQSSTTVELQNGLHVKTDYDFSTAPGSDIVVVTGGPGWKAQAKNPQILSFLKERGSQADTCIASVCTGA